MITLPALRHRHHRPWLLRYTTTTDGGSADIASLHGCNLLEQRRNCCRGANICPAIRSHIRTAIPGSLRYTTTTDGGSADIAGANICPAIHGHIRTAVPGSLRYTAHPWPYSHRRPWLIAIYRPSMDIKKTRSVMLSRL